MERRNGELARVQRERRNTTEGVSECNGRRGRAREYVCTDGEAWCACVHIIINTAIALHTISLLTYGSTKTENSKRIVNGLAARLSKNPSDASLKSTLLLEKARYKNLTRKKKRSSIKEFHLKLRNLRKCTPKDF